MLPFILFAQQVENLSLNSDVQSRRRLVRDDKLGIADKRHGYHNALPHTAAELVRITLVNVFRHGYADKLKHFYAALFGVFLRRAFNVQQSHLVKLISDCENGI